MSYLLRWVNEEGRLSTPVTSLEGDFASGLRFVELLHNAGVISTETLATLPGMHTLEVLSNCTIVFALALDSIGAVYKPSVIGLAASGARGGAPALLMSIKTALDMKQTSQNKSVKHGKTQIEIMKESIATVRPTKEPFLRKSLVNTGQDDFLEKTIQANPNAFDSNSDRVPFADVDMAVHLRKFHDFQRKEEQILLEQEKQAMEDQANSRGAQYAAIHAKARHRACMDRAHYDYGESQWRLNQEAQVERERSQLRYELALQERRKIKSFIKHRELALEATEGTEQFEMNLRRLGISEGETSSEKQVSTANESAISFLHRLEKTERVSSMSKDEAHVLLEMIGNKVKSARTARHERERRRRKMVFDQMSAQKEAEHAHSESHELGILIKEGKQARTEAEVRWKAMKMKRRNKEERERLTKQRQDQAKDGAAKAMAELTESARAAYDASRSERQAKVNAQTIDHDNKLQMRHNLAVDMCSDIVDGLFYLTFAVIDKRLEVNRPLVLSDWISLRRQFVKDSIRPLPPPPPPQLNVEESVCLSLDQIAFSSLSGGWKVQDQTPMSKKGFDHDLIAKYEKVLSDISSAIRSKEQHTALTPNHLAAWTAFPQPFPYKVPQDDMKPQEMIQPTMFPKPQPLRVRICIIPDPVLSAKIEIAHAPKAVAKLISKMQHGHGSATPSPRPSPRPSLTPNRSMHSARYSFNGSFNGDMDDDDNISIAPGTDTVAPSEEAVTAVVQVLGQSLDVVTSDPSTAMDAALVAATSAAVAQSLAATESQSATPVVSNGKGADKNTEATEVPKRRFSSDMFQERLAIIGEAAQASLRRNEEGSVDSGNAGAGAVLDQPSDDIPKYSPALVTLAVYYHLGSQGGEVRPRRIVRSTDQAVMDLRPEEEDHEEVQSSLGISVNSNVDTSIKVSKVGRWAGRWRRVAAKPVKGWVVSNFPRSPLEAKLFDYLLSRGPNMDEGDPDDSLDTLIFEACPLFGKPKPSANKREDGSFEDEPPKGPMPQLDGVFWLTGGVEVKETAPVMLEGSRFSNFARVSSMVKSAAATFKHMAAEAHNNPRLAAKKREKREKEYLDKLEKDRINIEAEASAIAILETKQPAISKHAASNTSAASPPAAAMKKAGNDPKGKSEQSKGKKGAQNKEPVLSSEELAAQATAQAAALMVERNTKFAEALNNSLQEAQQLQAYYDVLINGTFACSVSVSLCTAIEKGPAERRFSVKNDIERRNSYKSEEGQSSFRSAVGEDDVGVGSVAGTRSSPIKRPSSREKRNSFNLDSSNDPAKFMLSSRASSRRNSNTGSAVLGEEDGGVSRRSSIRDDNVVRRGSMRDGPSRRASLKAGLRRRKSISLDNDPSEARFASVVEVLEICTEAAAARRKEWDLEAAQRLAKRLDEIAREEQKALEKKENEEANNSEEKPSRRSSKEAPSRRASIEKNTDVPSETDINKHNLQVDASLAVGAKYDEDDETIESDICKDLPILLPQLLDEMFILSMREYRRRSVLSVAGRTWLKLRREGSTCMPEGERAVRRPLERWKANKLRFASTESIACLDMVKIESSISKLKSQMAWSAACAVRSSDGDVTGRVAAAYLEKLRRFPDTARRLVDDLEVDLGDVAAARYAASLEGLRRFSFEAASYAKSAGEAAAKAASDIAMNEAKRVAASEYLLFDYFNDIKAHPLVLEANREHSVSSAPGTPSQPCSPVAHLHKSMNNKSPTPLAIAKATGNLGMIKKRKSVFEAQLLDEDDNDSTSRDLVNGFPDVLVESKPACAVHLDECLSCLKQELDRAGLLQGRSGPHFESALRTLSPRAAPSANLVDVKDETDSGYYETQMQLLKKKEYTEALLVIRIRGVEQMRGAVARAARLQTWANAAAEEAAGLPLLATTQTGPNQQLGPLAPIVEARTKAEHRAVAACARHLRHVAGDPQARRPSNSIPVVGGGGNAVNGLRNSISSSGGEAPLIRAMRRVVSDGGPLRAVGVFDGIFIPDPALGVDLGTSALSLEQVCHLAQLLAESWKLHSVVMNKNVQEAKEMISSNNSVDGSGIKELHHSILAGLLPFQGAEEAFAMFSGLGQGEARVRNSPPVPSVWGHPKLVSVLAEVFEVSPWMPPRPSIDTQACSDVQFQLDGFLLPATPTASPSLHQLPWRQVVHHLAVSVLNYIPPYEELVGMAQRLRSKKVSSGSSESRCRILVTRSDLLSSQFFFDTMHGTRKPSYPHFDFVGASSSASSSSSTPTTHIPMNGNTQTTPMNGQYMMTIGDMNSGDGSEYRFDTNNQSPRSQLNSAATQRKVDLSLNRNEIKVLKELYVNTFQQETGVRLIAVDALLLTLAAAPNPCLSSGFADGLFRAASVASFLHPCEHEPNEISQPSGGGAVSDMSFMDSYGTAGDFHKNGELKSSLRKHRVGKSGIVLSRKAIEMLLVVSPPPCGRVGTAESVSAFLDGESGYERSCISFEEFARRNDVKHWCQEGWFRLRELSTAFAQLRSEP